MGLYNKLSKIEQLIETNTNISYWAWIDGWISIGQLPKEMKECLLQFGYKENAPLFGVKCKSPGEENGKVYDLIWIGPGSNRKWTDLLFSDVDRNWRFCRNFNHGEKLTEELIAENNKIVQDCYETLSKLFAFLNIYIKHRKELVKLVNLEYDQLDEI